MVENINKNPVYTGKISDSLQNTIGTIAVWAEIDPSNEKSPVFTGKIQVDGVNYRVAIWKFEPKKKEIK